MKTEMSIYASRDSKNTTDITLFVLVVSLRDARQQIEVQTGWVFSQGSMYESVVGPGPGPVLFIHSEIFFNFSYCFSLPQNNSEIMRVKFPLGPLFHRASTARHKVWARESFRPLIQVWTKFTALNRLHWVHCGHRKAQETANSFFTSQPGIWELYWPHFKTWNVLLPVDHFREILLIYHRCSNHGSVVSVF